jgi:hypothetical protein
MNNKMIDKQTISLSNQDDTYSIHDSEINNFKRFMPMHVPTRNPISLYIPLSRIIDTSENLYRKKEEVYDKVKEGFKSANYNKQLKLHRFDALRDRKSVLGADYKTEPAGVFRIKLAKNTFKLCEIKIPRSQAVNISYNKNIAIQSKLNATSSLLNTYFNTNIKFKGSPVIKSSCLNSLYKSIKSKRGTSTCW